MLVDYVLVVLYVFKPAEVLQQEAAGIEVDASVLDYEEEADLVAEHVVDAGVVDQLCAVLLIEIEVDVGVRELADLPPRAPQLGLHVPHA